MSGEKLTTKFDEEPKTGETVTMILVVSD